jgi:HD superfamily phosphohydrolase
VLNSPEGIAWPSIRPSLTLVKDALLDFNSAYHHLPKHEAAGQVLRDIRKLYPEYLSPLGVPEFAADVEGSEQITLSLAPVHVPPRGKVLVEHPLFQRLRLLPQLERLDYVYPDARQTRFSHSLLTFSYCRQALRFLLVRPEFRLAVEREDIEATLLLALIHDIGHYPLSHMFEDLEGFGDDVDDPVLDDDELFFAMFSGQDAGYPAVSRILANVCPKTSPESAVRSAYSDITAEALMSIARCAFRREKPTRPIHRMLAGLISSAGDVDKLAYLAGDSHFSGVPYGKGIDVWGYMRTLRVPEEALATDAGHPILAIDERGLKAVESLISARYGMLGRVYWHDRNRAVMAMYKDAIFRVFSHSDEPLRFSNYVKETFWSTAEEATSLIRNRMERQGHDGLLSDLRGGQRLISKELLALSHREDADAYDALTSSPSAAETAAIGGRVQDAIAGVVSTQLSEGCVVCDVPNKERDHIHAEEIRVIRYQRTGERREGETPLDKVSETIERLGPDFLNQAKRVRIFVRANDYDAIAKADEINVAAHAAREVLGA